MAIVFIFHDRIYDTVGTYLATLVFFCSYISCCKKTTQNYSIL